MEHIISAIGNAIPSIQVRQLQTSLPGDDAGLWFASHPKSKVVVNVESHNGDFPFLIENSRTDIRVTTTGIDETIEALRSTLDLAGACRVK